MGVRAFAWARRLWRRVRRWREQRARPLASEPVDGLSFLPTPGPGDSEGGDIFPPVRRGSS
jgi:hypothetical protein